MSNSEKKRILRVADRLLVIASSITLRSAIFNDNLDPSQVNDEGYDNLLLTEEFKLEDDSSDSLTLYCYASSSNGGISLAIEFPQAIPSNMEVEALKMANHLNIQATPCAISLNRDGRFMVSTSTVFKKYFNDELNGLDALQDHVETVIKLLTELLSTAKKLSLLIDENFDDTSVSALTTWESLIPEHTSGRCKVSPITNEKAMTSLYGFNPDLDIKLKFEYMWKNFCRHEIRAFSIQSKKFRSIVWISYLGRRGSQWHVIGHYSNNMNKVTRTHKLIAHDLAEKYQALWHANTHEK